ncbi:hypothetical protein DFH27DRAFT_323149 [Peziza echinospora]|nr:hypothetical protein DFH27DRAFT_323149 [Peziza echinospora]
MRTYVSGMFLCFFFRIYTSRTVSPLLFLTVWSIRGPPLLCQISVAAYDKEIRWDGMGLGGWRWEDVITHVTHAWLRTVLICGLDFAGCLTHLDGDFRVGIQTGWSCNLPKVQIDHCCVTYWKREVGSRSRYPTI